MGAVGEAERFREEIKGKTHAFSLAGRSASRRAACFEVRSVNSSLFQSKSGPVASGHTAIAGQSSSLFVGIFASASKKA